MLFFGLVIWWALLCSLRWNLVRILLTSKQLLFVTEAMRITKIFFTWVIIIHRCFIQNRCFITGFIPGGAPIQFNQNYDKSASFKENPLWTYKSYESDFYLSSSSFHNTIHRIVMNRQGDGIVTRLVFPIALLLILAAFTFWAGKFSLVCFCLFF
jgi:hypothetical protein